MKRCPMTIDARNGCWGNEEASADDGILEVSCGTTEGRGRDGSETKAQALRMFGSEYQGSPAGDIPPARGGNSDGLHVTQVAVDESDRHSASSGLDGTQKRNGCVPQTDMPRTDATTAEVSSASAGKAHLAPTEAERAVDKVLAAHRLKEAVMDLNRASERARLFRESTAALLPEFAHLLKAEKL